MSRLAKLVMAWWSHRGDQPPQIRRLPEGDVERPFALVGRPVVGGPVLLEELPMEGVEMPGDGTQVPGPAGFELPVQEPLGAGPVRDPGEAVVPSSVRQARLVHLPGEPFPAVQADLDREGKPGLDPGVHEPEPRVEPVVVQEQALAPPRDEFQVLGRGVAVDLEAPAGLHAAQHAHQPGADAVAGRDAAGDLLLARLRGGQVLDRPPQGLGFGQGRLLEPPGHLVHVGRELLQQDVVGPEVVLHAHVVHNRAQGPSEDQPVEPGQRAGDLVVVFGDELVHGVSPLLG
jgi:hypothetical protein